MDIGTISSRYAKALFSLAKEKGLETRVYDDMKMLADSFSLEPGLRVALGNPILPAEEKLKLLTAAGGIEVSDLYERFMHLVLEHKRESLLLFMAHIYIHLYRKDKRITRVQFSTAVPVSDAMLENALYSVISPRGAASILWKDGTKEKEACEMLKITAEDLMKFGVCDKIIAEPTGGAHMSREQTADNIYEYLVDAVYRLKKSEIDELLEKRYAKFRKIGMFTE